MGPSLLAWSLSTWHSVATVLPGRSRSSCAFAHESSASYVLASDAHLTFITIDVVVSGIIDWGREDHCSCPSTAIPDVAPDFVCCTRHVSGSPRLAPTETNPTVHDPIVPRSMW